MRENRGTAAAPRELAPPWRQLMVRTAAELSDAELLAIMLNQMCGDVTAFELAHRILQQHGSVSSVFSHCRELANAYSGLGPATIARLEAAQELVLRQLSEGLERREALGSSADAKRYLQARYGPLAHEVFICVYLTNQQHVVKIEELFRGTIDGAPVYPREVVKRCLHHNAAAVIFAHNHPSGVAEPSSADIGITKRLQAALATVDIRVLDHLVVARTEVVSLAERNLLG